MSELKEIKLGFATAALPRSTMRVDTNCGPVSVTVVGEKSNDKLFPLVTLHDFAFDHVSQFQTFENCGEEADRFFSQFVTYHIDMPGCEERAGDITGEYPSMDDLPGIIAHVRTSLNISKPMILLGVGAGANVAMRYMVKHTKTVLGVILVELTNDSETWVKWTQDKITDMVMKPTDVLSIRGKTSTDVITNLVDKHFGRSSSPSHTLEDTRRSLTGRMLASHSVSNMELYYQSFYRRAPLPDDTFTDRTCCPALIISGKQSWRNDNSIEARVSLQKSGKEVTLLEPSPCFLFPLEEAPKKAAISMMLFIQGLGLGLSAGLTTATTLTETYDEDDAVCDPRDLAMV